MPRVHGLIAPLAGTGVDITGNTVEHIRQLSPTIVGLALCALAVGSNDTHGPFAGIQHPGSAEADDAPVDGARATDAVEIFHGVSTSLRRKKLKSDRGRLTTRMPTELFPPPAPPDRLTLEPVQRVEADPWSAKVPAERARSP